MTRLLLRVVVAAGWLAAAGMLAAAEVAHRPPFLAAGLVALAALVSVLGAGPLGLRVEPWEDVTREYGLARASRAAVAVLVRGSAWPLFAWQAGTHGGVLPFPAVGDVPLLLQTLLLVVAVLAAAPAPSLARSLRLGFDAVLSAWGLVLALWVLVIGPVAHFRLGLRELLALGLVFGLLLQVTLVCLVVAREPVTHGPTGVLATAALVAAEVGVVVTVFVGGRDLPWPLAVCWVAGWALMVRSILVNRPLPADLVPPDVAERREILSTDLATGTVVLAVFVSVVVYQAPGDRSLPGGWAGAVLLLVGVVVLGARESLLGRLRARLTTQLRRQARVDPLTGLVNRRGLTEQVRRIPQDAEWAVLALDLDGFKAVNDVHGHAAGDEVLVVVGRVLAALCPAAGVAARTGGDEFTVLAPGDLTTGRQLGVRIAAAVREELAGLGLGPRITVSVGVGRAGRDGSSDGPPAGRPDAPPDRLAAVVEAAAALRSAKQLGRDRVQVYPGLVARQRERSLLVESRLRVALREQRIDVVAQPIVDLTDGRAVAVEALARWDDELLGAVPPAEFVVVAERTGLVGELGRSVLAAAARGYHEQGLAAAGVRLAVNVSPLELRLPGYVEGLAQTLAEAGVAAPDLVVEVTEAVVVEADDPAVRVLGRLNDLGVQVSIDDFGTGYSALGYLRRLPVQALKVDRSLVAEALTSVRTRQIVAGVVDLARRLGLVVTLEGLEDEATTRLAHELGARHGQGFWLSRPLPWADLTALGTPPARLLQRSDDAASPGPLGADAG